MASTKNNPPSVCLDLSRLISRVGRGPMTGIDRAELAYLRELSKRTKPLFALVRVRRDFFLLDRAGALSLLARLQGKQVWGDRDLRSRLFRHHPALRQAALSDLRRLAVKRVGLRRLAHALSKLCGSRLQYLNVGHSNIENAVFDAVKSVSDARILVFLHDVIPIDFPQYQRAGSSESFAAKLRVVSKLADCVIYPSADTRHRAERHLRRMGRIPASEVIFLGAEMARPRTDELPPKLDLSRPYFVTLGTIEPRKNHELLLDVWQRLGTGSNAPALYVVGQRGWNNAAVFARLDAGPPNVVELNALSDGAVSALLAGSAGLLFPSHAEGFGLPPVEAALLGAPVICSDLAVYREFLAEYPIYLDATDVGAWVEAVLMLSNLWVEQGKADRLAVLPNGLPTWENHMNRVLKLL